MLSYNNKIISIHLKKRYIRFNNYNDFTFRLKKHNCKKASIRVRRAIIVHKIQLLDWEKNILFEKDIEPIYLDRKRRLEIQWSEVFNEII